MLKYQNQAVLTDKWVRLRLAKSLTGCREKWLQALSIDPDTGLDPPGYKVRAAQGLDAASEFIQGALNFSKSGVSAQHIIPQDIGFGRRLWRILLLWTTIPTHLIWLPMIGESALSESELTQRRLAYYNLEERDAYFTRLKAKIEMFRKTNNQKVVICSHS